MVLQPQKTRGSVVVVFLIGLLVVGLFGAGGYLVYQNRQNQQQAQTKIPSPPSKTTLAPSPASTLTPTPNPFADWLTYTDQITFKYPKEVDLKVIKEEKTVNLSLWGPTQKKDTEFFDGLSLTFSQPVKTGNLSLSDYVDEQIKAAKEHAEVTKNKQLITIGSLNGYTFTTQGLGTFETIILQSPDKTRVIEITNATVDPANQGFQDTVDKILSTFDFL